MGYPKLASRIAQDETIELLELLERGGTTAEDPVKPPEFGRKIQTTTI